MIVHVCDASHPEALFQRNEVQRVLKDELHATDEQLEAVIDVYNKIDCVSETTRHELGLDRRGVLTTCATSGQGVDELMDVVAQRLIELGGDVQTRLRIPTASSDLLSWLYSVRYFRRLCWLVKTLHGSCLYWLWLYNC